MNFELLKKKKKKEITTQLEQRFGINEAVFKKYHIYQTSKENFWITTKHAKQITNAKININTVGLNFLKKDSRDDYRLTLEGTTLFAKNAKKRIININQKELDQVIRGIDLEPKPELELGYYLLKFKTNYVGCAKNTHTKILIYTPKNRRIKNLDY